LAAATDSTAHYVVFSRYSTNTSPAGIALSTSDNTSKLAYNPNTNVLTVGSVTGNVTGNVTGTLSGTATTALNVALVAATDSVDHYIVFSRYGVNSSPTGIGLSTTNSTSKLSYNPNTNILNLGTGSVTANSVRIGSSARTIDTSTGNLVLDSNSGQTDINDNVVIAGNLTVQGSTITVDSVTSTFVDSVIVLGSGIGATHSSLDNNQDRGIEFRWVNAGTATTGFFGFNDTDGKFRFIPDASITSTNVYSGTAGTAVFTEIVTTLAGNAAGVAATYTTFWGNLRGNVTGTATTSTNSYLAAATDSTTHYVVFSRFGTSTSGIALSTSDSTSKLAYNPNTNVLTVGSVTGTLSGTATTALNVALRSTSEDLTHYVVFSRFGVNASPTGIGLSTTDSTSKLAYNPSTNILTTNLAGTATTSTNSYLAEATHSAAHYVVFSLNPTSTSGIALSTSNSTSKLAYNPNTNVLTVGSVTGNLTGNVTGNVTGTATTAVNVSLAAAATDADHYLTFSRYGTNTSPAGIALSTSNTSAELTYNPVSKQLKLPYITGTAFTATSYFGTWAGSTITSFYGGTGNKTYTKGDLLVGGLGNTLMVLPKGASDRYLLRVDSSNNSVGLGWTTFAGTFVTSIAPAANLIEGDLWYKVDDGSFNVYYIDEDNTAQWVEIVGGSGAGGGSATPAGSNTYVQFNDNNSMGGSANFTYSKNTPTLSLKGFPVDAYTGCALEILGPAKTLVASTGTFLGMNSSSGFAGVFIEVRNNDVMKFTVEDDGATYIATLTSNGTVYSNSGYLTNTNPSDQNLKQNIQSMIGGTDYVNQLNPVSFEWKSEANGTGTKFGFIAQEVQEIIPEIVSTDSTGTLGLDTVSMIPFLVKAIKEQQEIIDSLKSEIQNIKNQLGI
jgi:precorrin-6B methylase 2